MKVGVIGAGIVGLSVARDLALRGIDCILIEQGAPGCGTTTHCAGMLHSGARYAVQEPELAELCAQANKELRELAPFAISGEAGLFVSLNNDPPKYAQRFAKACRVADISISQLSGSKARKLEPALSSRTSGAFLVPDVIIDPQLLVDAYTEELERLGVNVKTYHKFVRASRHPQSKAWKLRVKNLNTNAFLTISVDAIVNAAGPWVAEVAKTFGILLNLNYIHGSMAVLEHKLSNRVISRCAPPSAGDVLIPSGNNCLVGSTWHELPHNKPIKMSANDLTAVIKTCSSMLPAVTNEKVIRTFTGVRVHLIPSLGKKVDDFLSTRNFTIIDHNERDRILGLVTALGGKLILGRYVAEKAADLLLEQFGINRPCQTRSLTLQPPKKYD